MNNIELSSLERNLRKYFNYTDDQIKNISKLSDKELSSLKTLVMKERKRKFAIKESTTSRFGGGVGQRRRKKRKPNKQPSPSPVYKDTKPPKREDGKPRILLIADVKGWAWWNKSQFLKDHLSDEFAITVTCVLGNGCQPVHSIDQGYYDLYFTYGYSYIDFLYRVPKNKKVTGITAHRLRRMIEPKMKMAGHHHANSKMLLKELHNMGYGNAHYIPNGVDENLFKPIDPIKENGELIVGHVGKECPVKGQKQFIIPAIKKSGVKGITNLKTWKDKIPLQEMPKIYNQMDVFLVASVEDGTPNPALEAAACGRPIISNQIGNMPEFIKDGYNGFIVPRKIDAYVEKINYFKKNRQELIRMGNNARKTIEEGWTWKIQAENYRNMFRKILK